MDRVQQLKTIFEDLRFRGVVKTQRDFASLLNINEGNLSRAMKGDGRYLTDSLLSKASTLARYLEPEQGDPQQSDTLLVLPAEARGGTIADFVDSVHEYDCERMISPVRGASFAMQVVGDSMSPEYPSGSRVIIKKVNEEIFVEWGKVYVLDTENGALLKEIRKTDKADVIECVSLNPKYDSFTINTQYIHGWYRVLMVLSLK